MKRCSRGCKLLSFAFVTRIVAYATWEIVRRQPAISGADFRTDFSFRARPRRTPRNGSGMQLSSPECSSLFQSAFYWPPAFTWLNIISAREYRMTELRLRIIKFSTLLKISEPPIINFIAIYKLFKIYSPVLYLANVQHIFGENRKLSRKKRNISVLIISELSAKIYLQLWGLKVTIPHSVT